jgi:hypothetical protein
MCFLAGAVRFRRWTRVSGRCACVSPHRGSTRTGAAGHSTAGPQSARGRASHCGGHTQSARRFAPSAAPCISAQAVAAAHNSAQSRGHRNPSPKILLLPQPAHRPPRTRQRSRESREILQVTVGRLRTRSANSIARAGMRRGSVRFRENIIGRGLRGFWPGTVRGQDVRSALRRAIALLDEQAREHRRSALLEPLIEQSRNLLAEICCASQTREFVALERRFGRGEQELPRRLGGVTGQGEPPSGNQGGYSNHTVIQVKDNCTVMEQKCLWKSVENAGSTRRALLLRKIPLEMAGACSNCAGDYENPERTAETAEAAEEDADAADVNGDA